MDDVELAVNQGLHRPGSANRLDVEQREIARKGGKSVPADKRSFAQNPDLAASAGKKGGQNVEPAKRSFSANRELAVSAGAKGGQTSRGGRGAKVS